MNDHLLIRPDGRAELVMRRRLPHPPEKVWRAVTEPEHLKQWFPAELTIDGDRVRYGFGPDGAVLELEPPRLFAHTWGEDELRWEIRPDGDGSLLTLTHVFGDRFGAAGFAAGWHTCTAALAALLDERPLPAPGDLARLHEDYVAILGLIPGELAGGTVRLERQLTRTAIEVWRALRGDQAEAGSPPPAPFGIPGTPAGPVTRAEPGKILEYETAGGAVRWELREGTGHGTRLLSTCPGAAATLAACRARAERLASGLLADQ
ncbi:SRPBCC family protein [Nonomuraea sp. MCN248]|uniref:SRPBCC family protein n=1 Tax=Nonomuraea corallina TaxID=2989783 RepID=A0ABT4SGT5_9ACTN|nr:SRPBCC family protein [Nonomuraea corallina]MDA0636412.1 SRPBCC family protein [Nonomuraea corallina]